ncbi:MAG: hypothetical protein ACHP7N_00335 [Caulobacterales bacterium]
MRRSAFAQLAGVSRQMISKYAKAGFIFEGPEGVEASTTLLLLEGRLDEGKRQAALAALKTLGNAAPSSIATPEHRSAKAEKDEVELQLKRLQYAREAGQLVAAADVDAAARQAVASMREAFGNRRRDTAAAICAQFGLPADKAPPLARFIAQEFEATLGVFADAMAALAR